MEIRYIDNPKIIYHSSAFNLSSHSEIIICNINHGCDSDFINKFEVKINNKWVLMVDAFKNHNLITDDHNTRFYLPINNEDKKRGYYL